MHMSPFEADQPRDSAFGADKYDLAADIAEDVRTLLERVTQWRSDNRRIADHRIETIYHGLAQATSAIRMMGAEEADMLRERAMEKAHAEVNFARTIREQM